MKRLFVVVGSLLVLPAFAEVVPQVIYDEGVEYIDDTFVVNDALVVTQEQNQVPETNQDVQNVAPKQGNSPIRARARSVSSSRLTAARSNNTNISPRSSAARRSVATRGNTTGNTNVAPKTVARASVVAPVFSGTTAQTSAVSTGTTKTSVLGGGTTLYNSNPRVAVSSARVSSRNAGLSFSASNSTTASAQPTTEDLDKLAEVTDYCKAQYALCMDNYCNVLDENQGRCSCSANLSNYEKTEKALAETTEALQDVAQQIQYIGLSAGDVETIFAATEAERALTNKSDSTQFKSDLEAIKRMIVDVKPGNATSNTISSEMFDVNSGLFTFSFNSTGFDLTAFTNGMNNSSTSSISNQRGVNLYKTAAARCKASVLNSCSAQGVDPSMITNAYDLQIDKACLAYERSLKDANAEMSSTVRNAKSVLEKARLMVTQNKNKYDLRGCVEALDSCMQSDFVCGSDYENCLDSTGKYIVNGEVVSGSTPYGTAGTNNELTGSLSDSVWTYGSSNPKTNAWGTGTLADYIEKTVTSGYPNRTASSMSEFLQFKIGYHDNSTGSNNGMCISVLNQCQAYTYKNNDYQANNAVIKEYLTRALTQIKVSQDNVLAEYAENCLKDVETCLNTNNYSRNANVAINACRAQITTCMNVNGNGTSGTTDLDKWVKNNVVEHNCAIGEYYDPANTKCTLCSIPDNAVAVTVGNDGDDKSCSWRCKSGFVLNEDSTGCVTESEN